MKKKKKKKLCREFHQQLFSVIERQCHISRYYNGWL
ncbi:hypothetical protein VP01_51g9 [Puccinia sorghi]|uniref:Uncharacterized protein n=1 Tax=Puccinia sorghi TaxID=27349 RepID=A0A0L6UKQ5_9BASI|nr:hypothetical protein VP01_51g9 [Puccinia sorghi]